MICFRSECSGRRRERGGALLELGLMIPVLLLMAIGATNIGLSLGEKQVLVEAARYGARRGAADGVPVCKPSTDPLVPPVGKRPLPKAPARFEGCDSVLTGDLDANSTPEMLSNFYACQLVHEAKMDISGWQVAATFGSVDGTSPDNMVQVFIRRNPATAPNMIASAVLGKTFPRASGSFLVRQAACSDVTTDA